MSQTKRTKIKEAVLENKILETLLLGVAVLLSLVILLLEK